MMMAKFQESVNLESGLFHLLDGMSSSGLELEDVMVLKIVVSLEEPEKKHGKCGKAKLGLFH